jgi:hypothetical protein
MKEVLIITYVKHRMQNAYPLLQAALPIQAPDWTYKDRDIGEEINVHFTDFGLYVYYEGTYGKWKGEYDGDKTKNVRPMNAQARYYHETKHMVTLAK